MQTLFEQEMTMHFQQDLLVARLHPSYSPFDENSLIQTSVGIWVFGDMHHFLHLESLPKEAIASTMSAIDPVYSLAKPLLKGFS